MNFTLPAARLVPRRPFAQALGIASLVAWSLACAAPHPSLLASFALGVSLVSFALSCTPAGASARRASLFLALFCLPAGLPVLVPWPLSLLAPLAAYALLARWAPRAWGLRPEAGWWARGAWSWGWILATILVSAVALVGWVVIMKPDLSGKVAYVPDWPIGLLILLLIAFSVTNAVGEELLFRGLLFEGFGGAFRPLGAVVLSSLAFGALHFYGFPGGFVGALLASIYGLMLGALREKTRGMLSPIAAHVGADMTIAAILFVVARS